MCFTVSVSRGHGAPASPWASASVQRKGGHRAPGGGAGPGRPAPPPPFSPPLRLHSECCPTIRSLETGGSGPFPFSLPGNEALHSQCTRWLFPSETPRPAPWRLCGHLGGQSAPCSPASAYFVHQFIRFARLPLRARSRGACLSLARFFHSAQHPPGPWAPSQTVRDPLFVARTPLGFLSPRPPVGAAVPGSWPS